MICPASYSTRQHHKGTKDLYRYGVDNSRVKLDYDVEHALISVFEKEIQSVLQVEQQKQSLMSQKDFSLLEIFRHIDEYAHGTINCDNLRAFFRGRAIGAALDEEDLLNWIRRYDRDVDQQLDFSDFVTSISPYCNYNLKSRNLTEKRPEIVEEKPRKLKKQVVEQAPAPQAIVNEASKPLKSGTGPMSLASKPTAASVNQKNDKITYRNSANNFTMQNSLRDGNAKLLNGS